MLVLRGPAPSMFSLLRSTLRLPKFFRSMLRRNASELARLRSALGRGLMAPPIGDRVALTLSSSTGVVVLIGGGDGLCSFGDWIEVRFELPALFGL